MGIIGSQHAGGLYTLGGGASGVITPSSLYSVGRGIAAINPASAAWSAANRALFVPFRVTEITTAYQMMFGCGTTGGGNVDVGIYDAAFNRLTRASAARSASNEIVVNIPDVTLLPGTYFMAMSVDGTTNIISYAGVNAQICHMIGVRMEESAYTLPDPATPVKTAATAVPYIGVWLRSE
jgi:hypothetical protein